MIKSPIRQDLKKSIFREFGSEGGFPAFGGIPEYNRWVRDFIGWGQKYEKYMWYSFGFIFRVDSEFRVGDVQFLLVIFSVFYPIHFVDPNLVKIVKTRKNRLFSK